MEVLLGKKGALGVVLASGGAVTVELTRALVFENNPGQKFFFSQFACNVILECGVSGNWLHFFLM